MLENTGELAWFRGEIWRSLIRPREFARDLAREHYGLAGVLVALVAGVGLSVGIDLLVLSSKGISPSGFLTRLVLDAFLLGVRLCVSAAVVAWVANGAVRLMRRKAGSLDQLFTALTFALAPLILIPVPALLAVGVTSPLMLSLAAAIVLVLVVRVLVGLALNISEILPPLVAAASLVIVVALGAFVLNDQVSRMRFLAYTIAPQIVRSFDAKPATGTHFEGLGFDLTLPQGWTQASGGIPGEAARYESSTATLVVLRARAAALDTADTYSDVVAAPQRVGVHDIWENRDVVIINGMVVVDDSYGGNYEGRTVVWRQFTTVPGGQGLALQYRVVEPADRQAALDEAASIAATWHVTAAGR
ncbi:MAG TPA: hypothetical protein VEU77_05440 [Candidatus Acidoferrales bacterium]|nr:hypothetical protein [Candidatus Acidoferrales bacterium]